MSLNFLEVIIKAGTRTLACALMPCIEEGLLVHRGRPFSPLHESLAFDLRHQYFDTDAAEDEPCQDAAQLGPCVELKLLQDQHATEDPIDHDAAHENGDDLHLVIVLHREVHRVDVGH